MQRRPAFTLVELLVVISVIALLIAILLPTLGSARQSARRAKCSSNLRSISMATTVLAHDNQGRFMLSHRRLPPAQAQAYSYDGLPALGSDHVSWVTDTLFQAYMASGIALDTFTCPERGADYIFQHTNTNWRVGYYLLAGRDSAAVAPTGGRTWIAPMSNDADGDLVMMTDVTESGTFDPPQATASHGPRGLVIAPTRYATPQQMRVVGSHVARLNGSVVFEPTDTLTEFSASTGGSVKGYWPDAASYGNTP